MSVGEEQTECPLCMEPLEMDDINFFPCTCGYQICRFCWHRIRTDENGLCPACRKQYPEDPAEFKPLTEDELQRIKKERRQKDLQRKQKAAENRKHLANVRVVQKNLVFVVGLSQRLADTETLKKQEYFGKFGKIHKVVINHSTSYAGAQGPSASAYVTYNRPEDALRAIQAVNNIFVDGRTLKASLGTTKYCSHFLRGAQCPKPDCMYLHELGEEAASFTKEEMQQGKHQEYEQKLYEQYMNSQNLSNHQANSTRTTTGKKATSPQTIQGGESSPIPGSSPPNTTNKDAWPSLNSGNCNGRPERLTNGNKAQTTHPQTANGKQDTQIRAPGHHRNRQISDDQEQQNGKSKVSAAQTNRGSGTPTSGPHLQQQHSSQPQHIPTQLQPGLPTQPSPSASPVSPQNSYIQPTYPQSPGTHPQTQPIQLTTAQSQTPMASTRKIFDPMGVDTMSLFSNSGFPSRTNPKLPLQHANQPEELQTAEIPDSIPVSSSTDWQAAFGFTSSASSELHDDDLGFDPWNESSKALADLIEKESAVNNHPLQTHLQTQAHHTHIQHQPTQLTDNRPKNLPPGFAPNHIGAFNGALTPPGIGGSKMVGMMHFPNAVPPPNLHSHSQNTYHDMLTDMQGPPRKEPQVPNTQDWQDGLRALLPNINISFGAPPQPATSTSVNNPLSATHKATWSSSQSTTLDPSWDPAIVTSGHVTDSSSLDEPPHWMASLQNLTDDASNHRLPFLQQFPFRAATWAPQAQNPPPGFHTATMRPPTQLAESQKLEGLQ